MENVYWWVLGLVLVMSFIAFMFGVAIGRQSQPNEIVVINPQSGLLFTTINDCLVSALNELKTHGRRVPLNPSRIASTFDRVYEKRLALPINSHQCGLRIDLSGDNYHFHLSGVAEAPAVVTLILPADWIKEGIDDVTMLGNQR